MDRYFRNSYMVQQSDGTMQKCYIYGHYSGIGQWAFKEQNGSTLINLCFNDQYYTKLDAIYDMYRGVFCDEITKDQYENLK